MKKITSIVYTPTYELQKKCMDKKEVDKLEQAVVVHGYIGASKKNIIELSMINFS